MNEPNIIESKHHNAGTWVSWWNWNYSGHHYRHRLVGHRQVFVIKFKISDSIDHGCQWQLVTGQFCRQRIEKYLILLIMVIAKGQLVIDIKFKIFDDHGCPRPVLSRGETIDSCCSHKILNIQKLASFVAIKSKILSPQASFVAWRNDRLLLLWRSRPCHCSWGLSL